MMSWGQRLLRGSLRLAAAGLLMVVVVAAALWGTLALWFGLPAAPGARLVIAVLFAGLGIGGLIMALRRRRTLLPLVPFTIALTVLLVWWSTIEPSNDRAWQPDAARLPSAEIDGDLVTLRNIRSFEYRSAADYTEHWHDRTVDLRRLDSLDLIAVYWMGDAIAHTMLSFGFAGEPVTISIETRKEQGEEYSTLAGFFRRYELYYVVADERDLIGLRTTYRHPPEDVYLYRVQAPEENIRRLFLEYAAKINQLHEQPEFYNTASANCTTTIVTHVHALREDVPLDWRMLLSGYFPDLVYERGGLDRSVPFEQLRRQSLINDRARAADGAPDFSRRIRTGLPGMSTVN
jgi:phosphate/sulfate permease